MKKKKTQFGLINTVGWVFEFSQVDEEKFYVISARCHWLLSATADRKELTSALTKPVTCEYTRRPPRIKSEMLAFDRRDIVALDLT